MAQAQYVCPECEQPIEPNAVQITGSRSMFECPACGYYGQRSELKIKLYWTTVTGGGGEQVLSQSEFNTFMDTWRRSHFVYNVPMNTAPTIVRSAGTFLNTASQGGLHSTQTVAAANRSVEFSCFGVTDDNPFEVRVGDVANHVVSFSAFVGGYGMVNETATSYAGIQIGSYDSLPPYSSTTLSAVAQLRYKFSTDTVELVTANGDGSSEAVIAISGLGTITPHGLMMELVRDPYARVVKAYIDGILVATSTPTTFPDLAAAPSANTSYCSLFHTSGTNAAAEVDTFFSAPVITIYDITRTGAV